jgi:hypothetical protein
MVGKSQARGVVLGVLLVATNIRLATTHSAFSQFWKDLLRARANAEWRGQNQQHVKAVRTQQKSQVP